MPAAVLEHGVACVTATDTRWARCDIKSVALLANVLLRQQAVDAGAAETILLRDGLLTDASASTVYVVLDGQSCARRRTRRGCCPAPRAAWSRSSPPGHRHSVSRASRSARRDLRRADEIWLSAATRGVVPVTRLDGAPVGAGTPGPLWRRMHALIEQWWAA